MKDWIKELDIKVTEDQNTWLQALYQKVFDKQDVNYRVLRAELHNQIAENFDPNSIDERLVIYKGTQLTFLGVEFLNPELEILGKMDKVIKAIKNLLIEQPTLQDAELEEIYETTKIDKIEISQILFFITRFKEPHFANGSSGNAEYRCRSIRVADESVFDNYLDYKSLDSVIESWLNSKEKENQPKPKSKKRSLIARRQGFGGGMRRNSFYLEDEDNDEYRDQFYCNPIFTSPAPKVNTSMCFVLMPFTEPWSDEVWVNMIRPSVDELGLQCTRADSIHGLSIIEDIWTSMNQSAFIIADLTNVNPNVMYEMGIVHTIGKPSILITQNIEYKPFDVSHLRQYPYEVTPSGASKFKAKLHEAIRDIYEKNYPDHEI